MLQSKQHEEGNRDRTMEFWDEEYRVVSYEPKCRQLLTAFIIIK